MDVLIVEDDDAMASALDAAVVSAGHTASRVARGATHSWSTGALRSSCWIWGFPTWTASTSCASFARSHPSRS